MLTTAAFNAFLKTLEEPPIHVKFILATTEKHKILPTILSRCQVYDFRRISVDEIVAHLQKICEKEGIQAEPMALHIIAQKSDGALRDALSIFDKMVSFSGKNLTFDETIKNLNVLDYEYYFKVVDSLLVNDPWQLLLIFKEILDHGHDAQIFINGLASHFRDLLVAGNNRTKSLLEVPHQIKNKYEEQASKLSPNDIFKALKTLNETDVKYKTSNNPRLLVELTLIQLSSIFKSKEPKK